MENYWQWKLMDNVQRIKLKPNVIPHIFDCQKIKQIVCERTAVQKRKRMHLVQDAINDVPNTIFGIPSTSFDEPETSSMISDESLCGEFHLKAQDKSIQVNLKTPFRSRGTNTSYATFSVACSTSDLDVAAITKCVEGPQCESVTDIEPVYSVRSDYVNPEIIGSNDSLSSDYESSEEAEAISESISSADEEYKKNDFKQHMVAGTVMAIEKEPKIFLGIPKKSFFLIKLLTDRTKLPVNHIYITLKKIRLNASFAILAIEFGLAASTVCRIFSKSLPVVAALMQELIVWPEAKDVQAHLPLPFRARYNKVVSIIDCLEIEIEKPTNPLSQALTWSTYYNCNTLKYLISCTPDGLINFISDGFGGRASDVIIVENSGYLDKLVPGVCIMADRGFKNISNLLQQKNCNLIRPPSVLSETKSPRHEVRASKRIAALRIHVERVIRRLREFKMLCPHACVDRQHIPILDFVIIIASGLVNMQDHLIKC